MKWIEDGRNKRRKKVDRLAKELSDGEIGGENIRRKAGISRSSPDMLPDLDP